MSRPETIIGDFITFNASLLNEISEESPELSDALTNVIVEITNTFAGEGIAPEFSTKKDVHLMALGLTTSYSNFLEQEPDIAILIAELNVLTFTTETGQLSSDSKSNYISVSKDEDGDVVIDVYDYKNSVVNTVAMPELSWHLIHTNDYVITSEFEDAPSPVSEPDMRKYDFDTKDWLYSDKMKISSHYGVLRLLTDIKDLDVKGYGKLKKMLKDADISEHVFSETGKFSRYPDNFVSIEFTPDTATIRAYNYSNTLLTTKRMNIETFDKIMKSSQIEFWNTGKMKPKPVPNENERKFDWEKKEWYYRFDKPDGVRLLRISKMPEYQGFDFTENKAEVSRSGSKRKSPSMSAGYLKKMYEGIASARNELLNYLEFRGNDGAYYRLNVSDNQVWSWKKSKKDYTIAESIDLAEYYDAPSEKVIDFTERISKLGFAELTALLKERKEILESGVFDRDEPEYVELEMEIDELENELGQ